LECLIEVDPATADSNTDNILRMGQRVRVELETKDTKPKAIPASSNGSPSKVPPAVGTSQPLQSKATGS